MELATDTLIIGAGPAGLQLGYLLDRADTDYLILERDVPGSFFKKFPRHRKLISINKVHTGHGDPELNLRWDWNSLISDEERLRFPLYNQSYFPPADDMVRYLGDFAHRCRLRLRCSAQVVRISRADSDFTVTDVTGQHYRSKRLVVATGVSEAYVPDDIPGIELAENYADMSVDPRDFAAQRVLILGKGNSGFETADALVPSASVIHLASPRPMTMAWKSKYVGHLRAVNNNLVDTYQLKSQNVIIDAICERIERRGDRLDATFRYSHAGGERETLSYDRVICCTGFRFDAGIFDDTCSPALAIRDRFPDMTSAFESTNVPGLFFAGTLMQRLDFKKKQSGFIHGFRYNVRALAHIMERRAQGGDWPNRTVPRTAEAITKAVLARANRSSALWQQTGFLCDVIVVPACGGPVRYYEEVPVDYAISSEFGANGNIYALTLEFGNEIIDRSPDPLAIARVHKDDVANAHLSTGIHPIVRRYASGALLNTHHVIEDIESEWIEDVHVLPLIRYFEAQLAEAPATVTPAPVSERVS
jgi:thioredoxin reductase